MKRIQPVFTILILTAVAAYAQKAAPVPAAEIGLNFSVLNSHPGGGAQPFFATGGSATLVYNINILIGVVADLGGYHNSADANFDPTTFTYLFGPRLSFRRSRFTPYVQALFGGARQWTTFLDPTAGVTIPKNGFAMAFGGGIDIRVKDHILLKPAQVEYLMTQVSNPLSTAGTQNNIRYTTGVAFTFGSK